MVFTGIVEEVGQVVDVELAGGAQHADDADAAVLVVRCATVAQDVAHGASIAVNGVCLTVIGDEPAPPGDALSGSPVSGSAVSGSAVSGSPAAGSPVSGSPAPGSPSSRIVRFDVMGETLRRSTIGQLTVGAQVNLERALPAHGRLDGHIVQGHVDGTAQMLSRVPGDGWDTVRFRLPVELARYVAQKGSIAVNGVSLTVSALGEDRDGEWFEVGLIPETLRATNLGALPPGAPVNLEVDVLAKYAERLFARTGASIGQAKQVDDGTRITETVRA